MSIKAIIALFVDLILGGVLLLMYVTHAHVTFHTRIVPSYWVYAAVLFAIGAATAWWLLGRKTA